MKSLICILALLFSASSFATCPVMTVTTPNSEYDVTTECYLSAQASSFGYIRFWLPSNPSIGDQYTFEENGASVTEHIEYFDDETQTTVSFDDTYTGGITVTSRTDTFTDSVQEIVAATPGYKIRVTFDGSVWQDEEGFTLP